MKHAGGRPKGSTKYKPILADKLDAYVDECYKKRRIPWIEWFCIRNNLSKRTFYHWARYNDDLNDARDNLMMVQRLMLMKLVVSRQGYTRGIIFLLKRNHGFREAKPSQEKQGINVVFC